MMLLQISRKSSRELMGTRWGRSHHGKEEVVVVAVVTTNRSNRFMHRSRDKM